MSEFNQTADDLMTHLMNMADGKTELVLQDHLTHFALDVIGKVSKIQLERTIPTLTLTGSMSSKDKWKHDIWVWYSLCQFL